MLPPQTLRKPLIADVESLQPQATCSITAGRRDLTGILFILASEVLNACVNGLVKYVSAWPSQRLMLVRFTADLIISIAVVYSQGLSLPAATDVPWLLARGAAYCTGLFFFWSALQSCLPVGDVVVTVIAMAPLILALLSGAVLHESIPRTWIPQMGLCIMGALLINKPMAPAEGCPVTVEFLPLGAAFVWSLMNLFVRKCQHVPPPLVSAFTDVTAIGFACATALATTGGDVSAAAARLAPSAWDTHLALALIAAITGWCGTQCNITGYQTVSVAVVASVAGSTSVPFNYCLQIFAFGEVPDSLAILGASIIVATNVAATVAKYRDVANATASD